MYKADLTSKSGSELVALLGEFIRKQSELYSYGITLPILDFQGFSFVEGNLDKFLKEHAVPSDYQKYYEIFTQPLHNSFAQDQEEALLELMAQYYNEEWAAALLQGESTTVKEKYPDFFAALAAHAEKYGWIYYVYAGPAFDAQNFLEFITDHLRKGVRPSDKLKAIQEKKAEISKLREQYIKELKPNAFYETILRLAGKVVWAKPRRKDHQSRSYWHVEKLCREIAKRLNLSLSQVRSTPLEVLDEALKTGKIDPSISATIHLFHVCIPNGDGVETLIDKAAADFYSNSVTQEKDSATEKAEELKGSVAHPGFAKGMVKIINKSADMDKMQEGDILVSEATTPSVVPAMKKAAAIVTNEGGLTCHAAIVSRELGIPCVVGTKIATKVLKDGDLVEVDAKRGVVRVLEQK